MIKAFKKLLKEYKTLTYLPIALADIEFSFPKKCLYPSLSLRVENFGIINTLEGRTVATIPEIDLALYQGAKIIYHEAVVINNFNGEYVFRDHLKKLYDLRNEAKRNDQELLQQLYKTYSNSLYGKLAQGIRERKMFNTRDGITKKLPKSPITNAYYAAMTTGLIRAALASVLVAIEELIQKGFNYKIISATTDGLLYGIDNTKVDIIDTLETKNKSYSYNSTYEALEDNYKKFKSFEEVDPILYNKLLEFPSLKLLQISHQAWDDNKFIEIKHVANEVTNIKTRGQVGLYKEDDKQICTILAKAGHSLKGDKNTQAQWILNHYYDTKVQQYNFTTLSNVQDILAPNNPIQDLVSVEQSQKISLDYDYKRVPINQSETKPHKDIDQFLNYRRSMEYLRNLNQRASIDAVEYKYKLAKSGIRKTGSNQEFCLRHLLRALVHGVKPFKKPSITVRELAFILKEYRVTSSKINHAKEEIFTPYVIPDTTLNRSCIRKILKKLNIRTQNNYKNYLELLLYKTITNKEQICYLDN